MAFLARAAMPLVQPGEVAWALSDIRETRNRLWLASQRINIEEKLNALSPLRKKPHEKCVGASATALPTWRRLVLRR